MSLDAEVAFREHRLTLVRYVYRLTGDESVAADIVQEVFVRLMESGGGIADVRGWLFTVATNLVRDRHRVRESRRRLGAGKRLGPDPVRRPDEVFERRRRVERMRAALSRLSERDRAILLMRQEGFSHPEIAEAVGVAPSSVGVLAARAIRKLQDFYAAREVSSSEQPPPEAGDG